LDSKTLFWNNKRLTTILQKALIELFSKHSGGKVVESKEPVFFEAPEDLETESSVLLRLNYKKMTSAVILGFLDGASKAVFSELMKKPDGTAPDFKVIEGELAQTLFSVVDPELRAEQIFVDPKSIICVRDKMLGNWAKVFSKQNVRLVFNSPAGEFTLTMPVFDLAFQARKTAEFYGFPETTRILIVDDSATTRRVSRYFLNSVGYQNIEECVDGQAAFTKLIGSRPQFELVIADWHMPNMTGIELLKAVRSEANLKNIPLLLVTGERNKDEVASAIRAGVSGYIVKPLELNLLMKVMKKAHDARVADVAVPNDKKTA
jgi:two-component system, chemotaxis family, chemotaxis protein CheY